MTHRVRLRLEVARLRVEDVRHVCLRIPVVEREPRALHLHHDPVPLDEPVELLVQVHRERRHRVRGNRRRHGPALPVPAAHDVGVRHQLVAAPRRVARHAVRVHVDQLHHPVRVRARRLREQVRGHVAGDYHIVGEHVRAPRQHVGPVVHEPLVLHEPLPPARSVHGPGDVRNRVLRVRHVRVAARRGRRLERNLRVRSEINALRLRLLRRPGAERMPLVLAALEHVCLGELPVALPVQIEGEPGTLDVLAEIHADAVAELQRTDVVAGAGPAAMEPRTEHDVIPVLHILLLERAVLFLRAEDVLLVPEAAHVQHRDVGTRQHFLHRLRLPPRVPRRVRREGDPRRRLLDAVLCAEFLQGGELHVPVIAIVAADRHALMAVLGQLHRRRVLEAERLPECALMEEVVAHPRVGHRRLRRDRLERGMRIHAGDPREPPRIRHAHHADLAAVVRHVLHQPVDRVPGVGRLVHALRVLRVVQRAVHDEQTIGAVAAAHVLGHEDVAVLGELLVRHRELRGAEGARGAVRSANEHDRERRGHGLRHERHREQLHAVTDGDRQFAAFKGVLRVQRRDRDERAGSGENWKGESREDPAHARPPRKGNTPKIRRSAGWRCAAGRVFDRQNHARPPIS